MTFLVFTGMKNGSQWHGTWGSWILGTFFTVGTTISWELPARAESVVLPDTTLGTEGSVVTQMDALIQIVEGGAIREGNLFHSFWEFNVAAGHSLYFANPAEIESIVTRVTGDNPSNIFGRLGVLGGANLFLLNPNGIVFGEAASLDINGSFYASTADAIAWETGQFSATEPDSSQLLTVNPEATFFSYLTPGLGDISNAGNLSVGADETLTLFGATVLNGGSLTAPGGTVQVLGNLVGLMDQATLDVSGATGGGTVFVGGDYQGQGIVPAAERTVVGPEVVITADALETGDGGRVIIWADEATQFLGEISAQGGMQGGDGGFVEVSGLTFLEFAGEVNTQAPQGEPGQLFLDPENIVIADVAPVGFTTVGQADGVLADFLYAELEDAGQNSHLTPETVVALLSLNDLTLEATDVITVADDVDADSDNDLTLQATTIEVIGVLLRQSGGGDIVLETPQEEGSTVLVNGGIVTNNAISGNNAPGGAVRITTHDLLVENGGLISTITLDGANAGLLEIVTADIVVDGIDSFIGSLTGFDATGDSGVIAITTNTLSVRNGAAVNAGTLGDGNVGLLEIVATADIVVDGIDSFIGSLVVSDAAGDSDGVAITTDNLYVLNDASISSATLGEGNAGQVEIVATGDIVVDGTESFIDSQVAQGATGNSGGISITTDTLSVINNASVSAATFGEGNAGQVEIIATGDIVVDGASSFVDSLVVAGAIGNSGGLSITANNLSILNGASVSAGTAGEGNAGLLEIMAMGDIVVDGTESFISSQVGSEATGDSGGISITTGNLSVLDDASVSAATFGKGDAGQIAIVATGDIIVDGTESFIDSQVTSGATGDSGGIFITTDTLTVLNDGAVSAGTFGEGSAGQVEIIATGDIVLDGAASFIDSQVSQEATGNSGGISITADNLSVLNDAAVSASTAGEGNSGQVKIMATGDIVVDGQTSFISSQVISGATGDSGGISITTNNLSVLNDAAVSASTFSEGSAGQIEIMATGNVVVDGTASFIDSQVTSGATGDSGGISITTNNLSVLNDAAVSARTLGEGSAGQVEIMAMGNIVVDGMDSFIDSRVESAATGDSGGISITTDNLSVLNDASVSASTFGEGNSGQIAIVATGDIVVDGINSFIDSQVGSGATGDSGGISITTDNLSVLNGASVSAGTFGGGNAGPIAIMAAGDIFVDGATSLIDSQVSIGAVGDSGGILIVTDTLSVLNSADINASTFSAGNSGLLEIVAANNITVAGTNSFISSGVASGAVGNSGGVSITTDNLSVLDGAIVTTLTNGDGTAGVLSLNSNPGADLTIALSAESAISALTNSLERGGDLMISSDGLLTIQGAGELTAESLGAETGAAGNINIFANSVLLDDGVELSTQTASVEGGGNINFLVDRGITLRRGSFINAESTNENLGSGQGGNITLDAEFVLAIPAENSDIIANAVGGDGGNILINAAGIFGLTEQNGLNTSELRANDSSDISASSQSGQQGSIALDADFEQIQGLQPLPENFISPDELVASSCIAQSRDTQSFFTVTNDSSLAESLDGNTGSTYPTGTAQTIPEATEQQTVQEPEGIYQLADGRLVMGYACKDDNGPDIPDFRLPMK